ncbi:protein ELF4-LIKE 1-like isoform X2 [Abrus precatorius]|uniref:Protein ELF4-LIKE 1-like isoform X2 n=1 Tax=Abrus precatorius TaxID=3816 RepID=A0A8B8JJN2_ABRPR|nr:protein ELF4-LIKE 1-like isoform X2 [Abrus precatorius]
MDETAATTKPEWLNNHAKIAGESIEDINGGGDDDSGDDEEECDEEAWDMLSRSFRQAQTVLDENRALIQKVNNNHESKVPDNMAKNVDLIRQISGNISKVLSIYSDLSVNFSDIVRQRHVLASTTVNHHDCDRERSDDKAENSGDDSAAHVAEKSELCL